MADPQVIQCAADCVVTVVHQISIPLLDMSPGDGALIASAILAVWAVGWAFRVFIQQLRFSDGVSPNED